LRRDIDFREWLSQLLMTGMEALPDGKFDQSLSGNLTLLKVVDPSFRHLPA